MMDEGVAARTVSFFKEGGRRSLTKDVLLVIASHGVAIQNLARPVP